MKTTKKSLLTSGLCLGLSAALLASATFAWFTDSVVNTGNTIQAGNLDVGFGYRGLMKDDDDYISLEGETADNVGALFTDGQTWEPGYSYGYDFQVTNGGSLALQWSLHFNKLEQTDNNNDGIQANIADVLDVYVIGANEEAAALQDPDNKVGTLSQVMANNGYITGAVLTTVDNTDEFSVVLKMQEGAGNKYQDCSVNFDVELRATQAASEADGFGNTGYDANADGSPDQNWVTIISGTTTVSKNDDSSDVVANISGATFTFPAAAFGDGSITVTVKPTTPVVEGDVTIDATKGVASYDIDVTGLSGSSAEITVSLPVGTGITGDVAVYHDGKVISSEYNATTGMVTFKTTSFSPFTVVWDLPAADEDFDLGNEIADNATVTIPQGVTSLDSSLIIDESNVTLQGATSNPADTVLNFGTASGINFVGAANSKLTLKNLTIQAGHMAVWYGNQANNNLTVELDNCVLVGTGDNAYGVSLQTLGTGHKLILNNTTFEDMQCALGLADQDINGTYLGTKVEMSGVSFDNCTYPYQLFYPAEGSWFTSYQDMVNKLGSARVARVFENNVVYDQDFSTGIGDWSAGTVEDGVLTPANGAYSWYGDRNHSYMGDWTASVDIYVDLTVGAGKAFDLSNAVNKPDGSHLRDFVLRLQTLTNGDCAVLMSNNASSAAHTDSYAETYALGTITASGWYTMTWEYSMVNGYLSCDMTLTDEDGTEVAHKTLCYTGNSEATGDTLDKVGFNHYLWVYTMKEDVVTGFQLDNQKLIINE